MVESIHNVGKKKISEATEVGEMGKHAEVQCIQAGKFPIKIWLIVTPFHARLRQRQLI